MIAGVLGRSAPSGIVCLAGIGGDHKATFDIGRFNRVAVLDNDVVFGAVNANRMHYEMAAHALMSADRDWLGRMISRRVPLARWHEALEHRAGDIKVVVDFTLLSMADQAAAPATLAGCRNVSMNRSPQNLISFSVSTLMISAWRPLPLVERHRQRLLDRVADRLGIVGIDQQRGRAFHRRAGEARQDQHAGILRVLRRHIFLGDQVHAVAQRRHQRRARRAVEPGQRRAAVGLG